MQNNVLSNNVIMSFIFGIVFIFSILALLILYPNPTEKQFEIFKIVIALAAGGVAAIIPGSIDLHMRAGAKFILRAGGALGVFVIVFFYSPAKWIEHNSVDSNGMPKLEENNSDEIFSGALDRSYSKITSPIRSEFNHQEQTATFIDGNCLFIVKLKQNGTYWNAFLKETDGICRFLQALKANQLVLTITPEPGAMANSGLILKFFVQSKTQAVDAFSGLYESE